VVMINLKMIECSILFEDVSFLLSFWSVNHSYHNVTNGKPPVGMPPVSYFGTNWRSAPSALLLHFPFSTLFAFFCSSWHRDFLTSCPNPARGATLFRAFDPTFSVLTSLARFTRFRRFLCFGSESGILGILADLGVSGSGDPGFGETWRDLGDLQIWENLCLASSDYLKFRNFVLCANVRV